MKENELQIFCNSILNKLGILYYHKEKGRTVSKSHSAGLPDLLIFRNGKTYFIEFKT